MRPQPRPGGDPAVERRPRLLVSRGFARLCGLLLAWLLAGRADALGPHEILLLVNGQSTNSLEIGAYYAQLRHVPAANIVRLDVPEALYGGHADISPGDFTRLIWTPATNAVAARGLGHVLAWVYAPDFPIRVLTDPPVSITGLTFLRNRPPEGEALKHGTLRSAVFAGPDVPGGPVYAGQSLDAFAEWLGKDLPLPAMLLGYTGERGNTPAEVRACLERGVAADATYPSGTIYFVTNSDIRAQCRQWQFAPVAAYLQGRGVRTEVVKAPPSGAPAVFGVLAGAATLTPAAGGNRYVPGAFAEHLTSFGALFHAADQTKLSAWIAAGATASAGTVTEPFANWRKFPSAWFFCHHQAGCTLIESFYQSVRCPLQTLPVGEPLAAPWLPRAVLRLEGVPTAPVAAPFTVTAKVEYVGAGRYVHFILLLDGCLAPVRDAARGVFEVPVAALAAGRHTLRVVARQGGVVRPQVFAERAFEVRAGAEGGALK